MGLGRRVGWLVGSSAQGTPTQERPPRPPNRSLFFEPTRSGKPGREIPSLVLVWMSVAPIRVLQLLLLICLREFVRLYVMVGLVCPTSLVFAVIPIVVVLVIPIVDTGLRVGLLRSGSGQSCHWCQKGGSQVERADIAMYVRGTVVLSSRGLFSQKPINARMHTRIYEALAAIEERRPNLTATDGIEEREMENAQGGLLTLKAERAGAGNCSRAP